MTASRLLDQNTRWRAAPGTGAKWTRCDEPDRTTVVQSTGGGSAADSPQGLVATTCTP